TVYWSHKSKLRSGKAYAKGPHLTYVMKQKNYSGFEYSDNDIALASRLLRLELTLGREFFARNNWRTCDAETLTTQWNEYFQRMIGDSEMKNDSDIKERIHAVALSEGRAKSAYGCWLLIQSEGWERAQDSFQKTTWYRHLKVLREAGLGDADISAGKVVPLRRRVFEAQQISTWNDLRLVA
ncbi:MAG: phage/plasmid replication protein, II/X family, partial [Porticoccus sp.]|nr:phage/plasmid replication protein, II/X family [Porticoccus sp.]